MSEWTKGPWKEGKGKYVVSEHDNGLDIKGATGDDAIKYYGGNMICESVGEANAKRIVDCVNSMAGIEIPTEWMAAIKIDLQNILQTTDLSSVSAVDYIKIIATQALSLFPKDES